VFIPASFNGFPAPLLCPLLNGRNDELPPLKWLHIQTCSLSTAKWTRQRESRNNSSFGSRVVLYWRMASFTFCFVSSFFNSKVITGNPLMNTTRSREFSL